MFSACSIPTLTSIDQVVSDENMFENYDGSPISRGEMPFKMHKIIFFQRKKLKISLPTLPNIFRPATRNTQFFLFGLV